MKKSIIAVLLSMAMVFTSIAPVVAAESAPAVGVEFSSPIESSSRVIAGQFDLKSSTMFVKTSGDSLVADGEYTTNVTANMNYWDGATDETVEYTDLLIKDNVDITFEDGYAEISMVDYDSLVKAAFKEAAESEITAILKTGKTDNVTVDMLVQIGETKFPAGSFCYCGKNAKAVPMYGTCDIDSFPDMYLEPTYTFYYTVSGHKADTTRSYTSGITMYGWDEEGSGQWSAVQFPVKLNVYKLSDLSLVKSIAINESDLSSMGHGGSKTYYYSLEKGLNGDINKDDIYILSGVDSDGAVSNIMVSYLYAGKTVELSSTDVKLYNGASKKISVKNKPSKTTVSWASSDETVAKVNNKGKITSVATGTAVITATLSTGKVLSCDVTVEKPSVSDADKKINLVMGVSDNSIRTVSLNGILDDGTETVWSSTKSSVATVENGTIVAQKAGAAVIKAKRHGKTYTFKVKVYDPVINGAASVRATKKIKLSVKKGGGQTTDWTSSDESVATVTSRGVVKGIAPGTVTISAVNMGKLITKEITVR